MGEGLCVSATAQLGKLVLSFYHAGLRDQTQVLRLWGQVLYPLRPSFGTLSLSSSLSPHTFYPLLAPELLLYSFSAFWLRSSIKCILLPWKSDCIASLHESESGPNSALTGTEAPTHTPNVIWHSACHFFIQQTFTEHQPRVSHWMRQGYNRN